jgi:hypothetical protein
MSDKVFSNFNRRLVAWMLEWEGVGADLDVHVYLGKDRRTWPH